MATKAKSATKSATQESATSSAINIGINDKDRAAIAAGL